MNKNNTLSKKFHRKYIFLQNSLVYFLNWRISKFADDIYGTNNNAKKTNLINKKKNTFHFLELEKISFQDYWKRSEHKKLEKSIHNMNKEFLATNNYFFLKNSLNMSKKQNVLSVLTYLKNKRKKPFFLDNKKMSTFFSSNKSTIQLQSKKSFEFLNKKNFKLFLMNSGSKTYIQKQKKINKFKKLKFLNFHNLNTFIPISDFRKKNLFFEEQKGDKFFSSFHPLAFLGGFVNISGNRTQSKKNFFIQYWIFPLLGFVVFFSSTPSFFDTKFKRVFETFAFSELKAQKQLTTSNNLLKFESIKFFPSFFPISSKNHQKNYFLAAGAAGASQKINSTPEAEQNLNSLFGFSYSNEFSKETYKQFQYFENDEFEKYCKFSFKIFQNSPQFFFFDLLDNSIKNNKQSLFYFYDKKSFKPNIYKKQIETKKNSFYWKWFTLNEQCIYLPEFFQQKQKFSFFYLFQIPQKAKFFHPIFDNNCSINFSILKSNPFLSMLSNSELTPPQKVGVKTVAWAEGYTGILSKTSFNSSTGLKLNFPQQTYQKLSKSADEMNFFETPLFNFSKTMFLFTEFEKNLNNCFHINLSKKNEQRIVNNNSLFIENFIPFSKTLFFPKDTSHFFNKCNHLFFELSLKSSISENNILQNNKKNLLNSDRQNFDYLTKWQQTQNFWKVKKNLSTFKFLSSLKNYEKMKLKKQNSFKISEKFINAENMLNLDFIYFRKLFSEMSISQKQKNKSKFQLFFEFSNFSKFIKLKKNKNNLTNNEKIFSNKIGCKKKNSYSFFLKKHTFEFFVFEHYRKNSKNFLNNSLKNYFHQKEKTNSSYYFTQKHFENLSFVKANEFQKNIFVNFENRNKKQTFKNFQNFSKITYLNIPIYLNFSSGLPNLQKDTLVYDLNKNGNINFGKENQLLHNPIISLYSSSIGKDENFDARLNNLSSNIVPFIEKKFSSKSLNLFDSKTFFKSKANLIQTFYEKTLMNIKKNKFLSFSVFRLKSLTLQNQFLFEKIKKERPFIFNNHKNFDSLVLYSSSLKTNKFLLKSAKFYILKDRQPFRKLKRFKKNFYFQQKNKSFIPKNQFFKNYFSNFHSKKFEKIFKTFLSPLNKENIPRLNVKLNKVKVQNLKQLSFKDKKAVSSNKLQNNKNILFKTSKDNILLQTLSTSVQKNLKNSNLPFFISFPKKMTQQKNTYKNSFLDTKDALNGKFNNFFNADFLYEQFTKNEQVKTQKNLPSKLLFPLSNFQKEVASYEDIKTLPKLNQNLKAYNIKNLINPSFILKRDGFVFFPSKLLEKFKTQEKKKKEFEDFQIQTITETNSLNLKRLEREKYFQKKRRMKKQKLETRRRKKRKRFYPRPIWLRFHLYKKFLKTRHSNLFFNSSNFSTQSIFPKKGDSNVLQFHNLNEQNKTISQNFSFRPNNVFVFIPSSNRSNVPLQLNFSQPFFFVHAKKISLRQRQQEKAAEMKTHFMYLNKNYVFNISKKRSFAFYSTFLKNQNEFNANKIYRKNKQNWGFSSNKNSISEKHIYKKFKNNMKYTNQNNILYKLNPLSQNLEHYKISGEILSEFLRLSWKSYWFLTNFQPYTKRITQNFRKMQKIESEINYLNSLLFLFQNKFGLFQSVPIFQNNFSNDTQDLLLRNSIFRKFFWYCNIKNSLQEKFVQPSAGNSFNQFNQKSLNFQNIQNFPEYNRILYSRISEILRNFKSLENIDDQSLYMHNQKKSKIPKRKNNLIFSNSSFFTKSALFFENFHIPSRPSIPAFSIFSSIFHDFSIKPTGEVPTLRSLWALHRTNYYHFQEKNRIRSLWTLKKRTDNLKSFKGTKKIVQLFRKNSVLEKLNSSKFLSQKNSKFYVFHSLKKEKLFEQKTSNFLRDLKFSRFIKKSNFFIFENFTNKKKFFVLNLKTGYDDFVQQLDIMSLQKFLNSQKKCSYFGIHTVQQNSKIFLRYLKFQLFTNTSKHNFVHDNKIKNTVSYNIQFHKPLEYSLVSENKDLNQQNSSKSSLNFWWSQKNYQSFDFIMNSQKTRFNSLQFIPFFSLSPQKNFIENFQIPSEHNNQTNAFVSEKKWPSFSFQTALQPKYKFKKFFENFEQKTQTNLKNQNFGIQTQIFWFGAIIFHLAIFFTILKLPEIRSVFKFQCILFSKFFTGFFLIIFSVFHLFKKYTKKGSVVAKKILSNTSSLIRKNKSLDLFSFDFKETSEFNNFIFSQNLQKNNLRNFLFYFSYSPTYSSNQNSQREKKTLQLHFQKLSFFNLNSSSTEKSILQNSVKNSFFELFFRFSKFSSSFFFGEKIGYTAKNFKKYKNLNLFFISIHNFYYFHNFSFLEKTKHLLKISKNFGSFPMQKFPMTFLKNSKSIFHFRNCPKQFEKKNLKFFGRMVSSKPSASLANSANAWRSTHIKLDNQVTLQNKLNSFSKEARIGKTQNLINWKHSSYNDFFLLFNGFGQMSLNTSFIDLKTIYSQQYRHELSKQKFILNKNYFSLGSASPEGKGGWTKNNFTPLNEKFNIGWKKVFADYDTIENSITKQQNLENLQTLYKKDKFLCQLALSFLLIGKSTSIFTSSLVQLSNTLSSNILDFIEKIMFSIYKFLEKPAEVFIEWIAFIFLIEWSSDIVTFVPDTLDIFLAKSFQKFNRPLRSSHLFLNFLSSRNENILFYFSPFGVPSNIGNFFVFWSYLNFTSFVFQKRMLYYFENFCSIIIQPDTDLLIRQRKGIIFWDIWAEILLKAAEKYNVNIPSFITLKEEQELFIEKLLQDKKFLKDIQNQTQQYQKFSISSHNLKERKVEISNFNGETAEQNSLKLFINNFVEKERFQQFYEFSYSSENKMNINKNQNVDQIAISQFILSQIFEKNSSKKQKVNLIDFMINQKITKSEDFQKEKNQNFFKKKSEHSFFEILFSQFSRSHKIHQKFFMLFSQPIFLNSFSETYTSSFTKLDRFSVYSGNQSGTYQGPETDLFIDIHPPKSLKHIQFSKYYEPAQYTLGSLICQIYSGLFSKQISKNILVIGSPGTAKTLFIQALAGETEMKMITDNAYRYATVLRGVAVGMKYLRDVFDALALQTPCFFLMEHIHVLGSKRPFLISDDENIKGMFSNFGLEQQEVHETNQMIYQLNRHSLVDYKRPYKGDFSMGIPTNFFVQNFYSNSQNYSNSIFLSSSPTKINKNLSHQNVPLPDLACQGRLGEGKNNRNPTYPLPIDSIEHSLLKQGLAEKEKIDNAFLSATGESIKRTNSFFESRLQLSQEQVFAPPATSPFTILMMKEQKKLKPKKIIQENSWGGLSTDQFISYQKESTSVRAKVALLADITMNLSRGKLDMITDLLVIIDSVRSNRGFVVFATTHLPSLLDPALRRPGRFDETISLAQSPNFLNRFEILKTNFQNSLTTLDFVDASIFTENLSEINLFNFITATKLSFFHLYKYTRLIKTYVPVDFSTSRNLLMPGTKPKKNTKKEKNKFSFLLDNSSTSTSKKIKNFSKFNNLKSKFNSFSTKFQKNSKLICLDKNMIRFDKLKLRLVSQIYPTKAFNSFMKSTFFYDFYCKKSKIHKTQFKKNTKLQYSKYQLRNSKLVNYTILPKEPSYILNFAYSKIGIFLAHSNLLKDPTSFIPLSLNNNSTFSHNTKNKMQFAANVLYDSQTQQKLQFTVFLSGKIAEFCFQKNKLNTFPISQAILPINQPTINGLRNLNLNKEKKYFYNQKLSNQNWSSHQIDILVSALFHDKFSLFSSFDCKNDNIFVHNRNKKLPALAFGKGRGASPGRQENLKNVKNPSINLRKKQSRLFLLLSSSSFLKIAKKQEFNFSPSEYVNKYQQKTNFYWATFGNDQIWRFVTPFLFSIIQKRFLFTKNLLLSKMLFFENKNARKQPPNPPTSSILMPSKKFENFKRTENDFVQKSRFSINEKIQMHQQQRFLKQLYNIPIQQYYRSEMIENRTTLFSSSFQELAYLDSLTLKFSSSHFYQKKYFKIRHRFSNTNQWWNGLLPEHNSETTYLSDVDWRTMFSKTSKQKSSFLLKFSTIDKEIKKQSINFVRGAHKDKNQTFEFFMDFPDAEQYYNPKNRRWYFNNNSFSQISENLSFVNNKKTSSQKIDFFDKTYAVKNSSLNILNISKTQSYWLTFDKTLQYEIYYHYLMQSFHKTYNYLNTHREMLDLLVFQLLRKGFLKELDYLITISRF